MKSYTQQAVITATPRTAGGRDERAAYRTLTAALEQRRGGASAADITAATALPLALVRELLPRAADEFSGRLEVTESGEILYSFPHGFTSRYRGPAARLKRFGERFRAGLALAGSLLFKVWIMVMLIGYFALFMAIAALSLFISVAASSRASGRRRGGIFFGPGIFDLIIRLWFYSELTRSVDRRSGRRFNRGGPANGKAPARPLHRAIFSFVFGDGDPAGEWEALEKKAVIAHIQANRGVISLPEFMALTGRDRAEAEAAILTCCAEFGGSPEATNEGTIVYRFDDLLLRAGGGLAGGGLSPPLRPLKQFSENTKTMNAWFGVINTVNLLFGSYFLYNALHTGAAIIAGNGPHSIYGIVYVLCDYVMSRPLPIIAVGLGLVPLVFSLLFWLIPGLRLFRERKRNEHVKLGNLKRLGFRRIWAGPLAVRTADIDGQAAESRPRNMEAARDRVIKDMGAYSVPEVEIDPQGAAVYSFTELEREQAALERYRAEAERSRSGLGQTVFDSGRESL